MAARASASAQADVVYRSVTEHRLPRVTEAGQRAAPLPPAPDFASERCLEWEEAGLSLRAWGHIEGFVAHDSDELAALEARVVGAPAEGLPAWVGFRTFTGSDGEDEWSGWPGCQFWLPRHVRVRLGDREIRIDHRLVTPSGSVQPPYQAPVAAATSSDRSAEPAASHATDLRLVDIDDRFSWAGAIEKALRAFYEGHLCKVVLSRKARVDTSHPFSPTELFERLGEGPGRTGQSPHPGTTRYRLNWPDHGEFIGRTPETLVRLSPERVSTEALAGTAPAAEAAALAQSDKDQREHAWVVEALKGHLASECSRVDASGPRVESFGEIAHLRTEITGHPAHRQSLLYWIARLHPSPAVAGTPRRAAMDFIRKAERSDRGGYAGVLAWTDGRGTGRAIVALRCALVKREATFLYAGGGIVPGSTAELEWKETRLKMGRLARILGGSGRARSHENDAHRSPERG